jgi:hypothetical protein
LGELEVTFRLCADAAFVERGGGCMDLGMGMMRQVHVGVVGLRWH